MTEQKKKREARHIPCPVCGEKTDVKVYEDTVLVNFPLYCPKCGKEVLVDMVDFKLVRPTRGQEC